MERMFCCNTEDRSPSDLTSKPLSSSISSSKGGFLKGPLAVLPRWECSECLGWAAAVSARAAKACDVSTHADETLMDHAYAAEQALGDQPRDLASRQRE